MTADTITITAGRPAREGNAEDFSGPDGIYPLILASVSDVVEETSRQPRALRNGKPDPRDDGKWVYRTWTFAIEADGYDNQVIDMRANARSTGPKSKQYEIIAALLGHVPQVGEQVTIPELVGRSASGWIATNENEFPYVKALMPAQRAAAVAVPAGRGFADAAGPVAPEDPTKVGSASLPF